MNKNETMNMLNCALTGNLNIATDVAAANALGGLTGQLGTNACTTGWNYWYQGYYPNIIRESYPVYLQDKAKDTGKQAFEIIKALQDKKLMKLDKVSDFIEAMDILIKTL
jgi:hypothetical protein